MLVVADASSIINLEQVELAGADLAWWLFKEFPVEISSTVYAEVKRHSTSISQYRKRSRRYDFRTLETRYLNNIPGVTLGVDENAGERHNCCLALEAIRRRRFGQCIFLIDDQKATRKFADQAMSDFLAGDAWNSLDLVLYLYFRHCTDNDHQIIRPQAENALKDLVAVFGSRLNQPAMSSLSPKLASLLTLYTSKLNTLHSRVKAFIK